MQEKLTIQDIARLAGVSKATVSRVLNRNASVAPELSKRVMRIVQEYDFVPNVTATGLAGGKTRLVGVLAPPLTWPSVPEIMRGVAEYIEHTSYEIILYSINFEGGNHAAVLERILSMRMTAGLLAILPGELSPHLAVRFHRGLPMVLIDDQEKPLDIPWVGIDNTSSAYEATRYLLELGHRRIAYIQGPQHYSCSLERYHGYNQALQDAGVTPDPALVFRGRFDLPSGRECAAQLFSMERRDWPSAIFAGNDQMAYGVLEVAEQQGIRIPEDIALVGFDDNPLSAHMRPPLTTMRQPFSEMGSKAIELLLTMIDPAHRLNKEQRRGDDQQGGEHLLKPGRTDRPVRVELPTRLVVRSSSSTLQAERAEP